MSSFADADAAVRSGEPVELDSEVVEVRGPDAATYLQGQLSQDVAALAVSDVVVPSLLLEPSGKLGFLVGVGRLADDAFLVVVDSPSGEDVLARLDRFKLRTDAELRVATGEWHVLAELCPSNAATPITVRIAQDGPGLDDERTAAYELARIELGLPRMRGEVREDMIPAELGQPLIDAAASFTKGCYTGQELVARVDSRGGNVPRHLRGLVLDGDQVPTEGDEVVHDDKVVGVVTTAGRSPRIGAPVALALVHRSVAVPGPVTVRGSIDAPAEVRELPLSAGAG